MNTPQDELEVRLHNVECMLLAYIAATKSLLSPELQRALGERQGEWYAASKELGAFSAPFVLGRLSKGQLQ